MKLPWVLNLFVFWSDHADDDDGLLFYFGPASLLSWRQFEETRYWNKYLIMLPHFVCSLVTFIRTSVCLFVVLSVILSIMIVAVLLLLLLFFSFLFFFCTLWGSNALRLLSLQDDVVAEALTMMRGCLWLLAGVCLRYSFCGSNLKVLYDQTHMRTHITAIHPSIHSFVRLSISSSVCSFATRRMAINAMLYAYSYNSIDLLEILSCSYCVGLVYIVVIAVVIVIVVVVILFKFIQFFMFDLYTFLFWPLIDFRLDKHFKNINVHTYTWIHVSYIIHIQTHTYIHT